MTSENNIVREGGLSPFKPLCKKVKYARKYDRKSRQR